MAPDAGAMAMLGWRRYTGIRDVLQTQATEFQRQLSELHRCHATMVTDA